MHPTTSVRRALVADAPAPAEAMADGFADDPFFAWFLPDAGTRRAALVDLMALYVERSRQRASAFVVAGTGGSSLGGAMWTPPEVEPFDEVDLERFAEVVRANAGSAADELLVAALEIEAYHPDEPHWYLGALALAPSARGRGLGGHVVAPVLEICDTEGLPAYLESSNPRNVSFYERLGFEVQAEVHLPDGPVVPTMLRTPR